VFESTSPAPDGRRYVGRAAIGAAWKPIFDDVTSRFTVEDSFSAGDHVVQRWRYDWGDGHVRGIDVFAVRDGQVTEKIAYVKASRYPQAAPPPHRWNIGPQAIRGMQLLPLRLPCRATVTLAPAGPGLRHPAGPSRRFRGRRPQAPGRETVKITLTSMKRAQRGAVSLRSGRHGGPLCRLLSAQRSTMPADSGSLAPLHHGRLFLAGRPGLDRLGG
jgi:SnoaL-like domain